VIVCGSAPGRAQTAEPAQATQGEPDAAHASAAQAAQETARKLLARAGLSGTLALDYFSSDHAIDDADHFGGVNLTLKQRLQLGEGVRWVGEARFMAQQIGHQDHDPIGSAARNVRYVDGVIAELREGYTEIEQGPIALRLGKQIIAWGRADELNPTDVITPKDYLLLLPEGTPAYRYGVTALRADYSFDERTRAIGVWVPVFSPSRIPFDVPPGVHLEEDLPAVAIENGSAGIKLDRSGGNVDASLAYFYGYNLLPELRVTSVQADPVTGALAGDVDLVHPRRHMIGADFATALGRFGYRGEVAYVLTPNADGHRVDETTPYLYYVLGIERTFFDNLSVIVQYVGRYVVNRVDPARALADPDPVEGQARFLAARETFIINQQLDTVQNGWSLRLDKRWWNDTLEFELLSLHYFERNDFFMRPTLSYLLADGWRAAVGGEIFHGPMHSLFGRVEKNTGAFAELSYSF
jgi:hypothetical protein